MTITARDRSIVRFVEEFNGVTISMCQKLIVPNKKSGYKIAQTRLNKLVDAKYLKVSRTETNENIYYINKKISYHDLLINNFFVGLHNAGAKTLKFEKPKAWLNNKFRSDAFVQCDYGDNFYFFFLEVCWTHKDVNIKGYEELCDSEEGRKIIDYKGLLPTLVILDDSGHEYISDRLKIVKIDYELQQLPLIFI
jgi:hypothetical protein